MKNCLDLSNLLELQDMIKDVANTYGYMTEVAIAMTKNKRMDDDKVYEYKKQIIDIHYELNHKLLMYMGMLRKLGISYTHDSAFLDFYKAVFDTAEKNKRAVFDFLESKGTKDVHIVQDNDSELLNRVIRVTEENIKIT